MPELDVNKKNYRVRDRESESMATLDTGSLVQTLEDLLSMIEDHDFLSNFA
jgi:hypothetical protein